MKLLKFLNCDAPTVSPDALHLSLEQQRVSVARGKPVGRGPPQSSAKRWRLLRSAPSTGVCYWLLNDDNTPIGPVGEILFAAAEDNGAGKDGGLAPKGIDETHVENVDLRSKMSKHLQRTREEYGQTFKTAAKSAALLMDAERLKVDRDVRTKRERERVVEAVESGEVMNRPVRARGEENGEGGSKAKKSNSRHR